MKTFVCLLFALCLTVAGPVLAETTDTSSSSEAISSITYDADAKTLTVVFERGTYEYADVPAEVHEGLKNSESQGTYYRENIKGKYSSTKKSE
ncbi:MAG TPA: KTSC domain-containing protein [Kiritimatiellia bacterium]|nr:KTSC domain-containing protein [Kiritimatiellia bacterium]HMP34086.1 KTSC domain-containing protein [Kiritimatiellia bacterium]